MYNFNEITYDEYLMWINMSILTDCLYQMGFGEICSVLLKNLNNKTFYNYLNLVHTYAKSLNNINVLETLSYYGLIK